MAATKRNARGRSYHLRPRFYVYELIGPDGVSLYIGKGSGPRLKSQENAFGVNGSEVARFWREADAYAYEIEAIAERSPRLNKAPGGNGSRAERKYDPASRDPAYKLMAEIGTRAYAARVLLNYAHLVDPSKLEAIRAVAYGR